MRSRSLLFDVQTVQNGENSLHPGLLAGVSDSGEHSRFGVIFPFRCDIPVSGYSGFIPGFTVFQEYSCSVSALS